MPDDFGQLPTLRPETKQIGRLSNDIGDGNENGKKKEKKKTIGLDWQGNNFARAFSYTSPPSLPDYHVKLPNCTFCGGRGNKTFFFLFLNFRIPLHKNLPAFDKLNEME